MKVSNRGCIRRLSLRALWANRTRNMVAVLAIALTALLFTSLFTIALSINEGMQQSNFRQAGGYAHGSFKYLTEEEFSQLKEHPLLEDWGLRRFVGMPTGVPFNKSHVEVGYSDPNEAHWTYCDPVEGRLPAEGTDEAATDTHVLELLGITPELGAQFTLTFEVDGQETTQTFTLCGWWEYDEAVVANHVLIPESRVNAILEEVGVTPPGIDGMTGSWNLDVMLKHGARSIAADLGRILADNGYQDQDPAAPGYIATGVNWGYTGAQLSSQIDPSVILTILVMLALILFTGYLIIYNVFQISVAGDIRFYGLLKTIGTTPRQIRRIIRIQALVLSAAGIPAGLLLGWLLGGVLTPVITAQLNDVIGTVPVSPVLFGVSALFALVTVLISCRRPGRLAGKVSPVEAVRYTEGKALRPKARRKEKGVSLVSMAWANLGRSRGKTAITIVSLSLAVVLLTLTVTFTAGFDMDKYTAHFTATDFIVADAGKLQVSTTGFNSGMAVGKDAIAAINAQGGVTQSARVYGQSMGMLEFIPEDWFLARNRPYYSEDSLQWLVDHTQRNDAGFLADYVQLCGMEPFALDQLTVLEGDLEKLKEPGGNWIAAVYREDDYGDPEMDNNWAKLGDTVTIRYVEKFEYYDNDTGEVLPIEQVEAAYAAGHSITSYAKTYRDVDYTVAALVTVPRALSYRYYGDDAFILDDQTFLRDSGTADVMYYAFNTTEEATASMEAFLQDYTENVNPQMDYESKATFAGEFESVRGMFLLLGGALSFIVGLVGVLNFANAILTGITARRRELAVLQSIGMTTRQLRTMLAIEGLLYTAGAAALALGIILASAPFLGPILNRMIWFFTYRFTLWPIGVVLPLFAVLGIGIPMLTSQAVQHIPVVERLRQE